MIVGVVDYGLGNIFSVLAALKELGHRSVVDTDGSQLTNVQTVLVPGVASFSAGLKNLAVSGQAQSLSSVRASGRPVIGLCLGAQMFLERSEESGDARGLGFVRGRVIALDPDQCRAPHQGWSKTSLPSWQRSQEGFSENEESYFYYSHNYKLCLNDPSHVVASTQYGSETVTAVYRQDNVVGVQFHPERSGLPGLHFLNALLEHLWRECA